MLAATLNSRIIRSTRTSRCSSPMPAMRVSAVSGSVLTRKVGSSSARRCRAMRQLVLVGLRLGLDLDLDDRLREGHRLEDDGMVRVGQGVAGEGVLEADGRGDVAGVDLVDLLAVVGVHLEDAADALALVLGRVVDVRAGLERARVDPEEGELADERVGGDLEGERAEGLACRRRAEDLGAGLRVEADHRRDVERRRQVVDDRVEHLLDALVLERRAGQDRDDLGGQGAEAQAVLDLLDRELLALEVLVGQLVVHLGDGLDHACGGASRPRPRARPGSRRRRSCCRGRRGSRWPSSRPGR